MAGTVGTLSATDGGAVHVAQSLGFLPVRRGWDLGFTVEPDASR